MQQQRHEARGGTDGVRCLQQDQHVDELVLLAVQP